MKVGISGPFSGPRSRYGALLKQCVAALSNSAGSTGTDIEFLFADDKATESIAIEAAHYFRSQGVSMVLGHFNSACAIAVQTLYEQWRIGFIAPASTHNDLGKQASHGLAIFCPSQNAQAEQLFAPHCNGRTALVHDGLLYGKSLAQYTHGLLHNQKKTSVLCRLPLDGVSPLTAILSCNTVVYCGAHYKGAALFNSLVKENYKGRMLASDDSSIPHFTQLLNTKHIDCRVAGLAGGYQYATEQALQYLVALAGSQQSAEQRFQCLGTDWGHYRFDQQRRIESARWVLLELDDIG